MFKIHTIVTSSQRTLAAEVVKWMNANMAGLKWSKREYLASKNSFDKDEFTCFIEYMPKGE